MQLRKIVACAALLAQCGRAQAQVILTYAGGFGQGAANQAELLAPLGVTIDGAGNLYVADGGNNIIRRQTPGGVTTVIAGAGCSDYFGDGGPATDAGLWLPGSTAIDAAGNVYVADIEHSVVRKVSTAGIVTTVAGTGANGFSGDNGPATAAAMNEAAAVAIDPSGNLYVADQLNNRIRKIDGSGVMTTYAGTGTGGYAGDGGMATDAQLRNPIGVYADSAGNLYIADMFNQAIRKVDVGGHITTVAGNGTSGYMGDGGAATAAQLNFPTCVFADAGGNLFIGDCQNNVVRKVSAAGIISTVAGNHVNGFGGDGGAATAASLSLPYGVATDAGGNLYIADQGNNRIRKVSPSGIISTVTGPGYFSGDGGPALAATLYHPQGLAINQKGEFFVGDGGNRRIRKIDTAGIITTIAGSGAAIPSGDGGPASAAGFYQPIAVACDTLGDVFVLDTNNTVRKIDATGMIATVAGTGTAGYNGDSIAATSAMLNGANGIAASKDGVLYISDGGNNRIRKVTAAGIMTTCAGTGVSGYTGNGSAATAATLNQPLGVSVGPGGDIYIADYGNYVVRRVAMDGTISTFAGTGVGGESGFGGPATAAQIIVTGVNTDDAGNVYLLNNSDDIVMQVNTAGIITHVAGTSSEDMGLCGQGGVDSLADLANPTGVVADATGNIYIADEFTNRVRIINVHILPAGVANSAVPESTREMTILPNPATDKATVRVPGVTNFGRLVVYDAMGRTVATQQVEAGVGEYTLQLQELPSGMYLVCVVADGQTLNGKLMIAR